MRKLKPTKAAANAAKPSMVRIPNWVPPAIDTPRIVERSVELGWYEHHADRKGAPLRGGNQGTVIETPRGLTSAGHCHRKAAARMLGCPEPAKNDREQDMMFEAGFSNEDIWLKDLRAFLSEGAPGVPGEPLILREEEIPALWEVDGVDGSGRPDLVLATRRNGKVVPLLGHEYKLACSLGTALEVLFHGPKLEHMAQASRYQTALTSQYELPRMLHYEIWYALRVVMPIPDWGWVKKIIKGVTSEYFEYSDAGNLTKLTMFRRGYSLAWHEDCLHWRRVGDTDGLWTKVPMVTRQNLDRYWRLVLDASKGIIGSKVSFKEWDGSNGFDKCKYCGFEATCKGAENAKDPGNAWLRAIKLMAREHAARVQKVANSLKR